MTSGHLYAMTYSDGMTSVATWQALNFDATSGTFTGSAVTSHATLQDALETFRETIRETYRDGVPSDDGGPWADVYRMPAGWLRSRGLEPDSEPSHRITVGPRGAARLERVW